MSETFELYIKNFVADTFTFEDAARYYLSEKYDKVSPVDMLNQLEALTQNSDMISVANNYLVDNPEKMNEIFRRLLMWAWDQEKDEEIVGRAIKAANGKLGFLDKSSYTLLALFAMWILATGGKVETIRWEVKSDGSTVGETVHYASSPLQSFWELMVSDVGPESIQGPKNGTFKIKKKNQGKRDAPKI